MLPFLVLSWIGCATGALSLILIPIDWFGPEIIKNAIIKGHPDLDSENLNKSIGIIYTSMWIGAAIGFGA